MKTNRDLAISWLKKADSDLADAKRTVNSEGPYDTACFHAQQCIEKVLKGYLSFRDFAAPKTHDVEELQRLCLEQGFPEELAAIDLTDLTDYAVEFRYDADFWPPVETAEQAILLAEKIRNLVALTLDK